MGTSGNRVSAVANDGRPRAVYLSVMSDPAPTRSWREIAAAIARESDRDRVLQLSQELDRALEKAAQKGAQTKRSA